MKTDYKLLSQQLESLIAGVPYLTANLANASALLWQELDGINWAGFYLAEGDVLVLGPFQGKPACIEIPYGKGVCGTAFRSDSTVVVDDVHQFPGHIACSSLSRSEIVVPLFRRAAASEEPPVTAVLDIDSTDIGTFDDTDARWLEKLAALV